jgi:hypothetical protein
MKGADQPRQISELLQLWKLDIPPGVRAERNRDLGQGDAATVVTVAVHLRNEHRIGRA